MENFRMVHPYDAILVLLIFCAVSNCETPRLILEMTRNGQLPVREAVGPEWTDGGQTVPNVQVVQMSLFE